MENYQPILRGVHRCPWWPAEVDEARGALVVGPWCDFGVCLIDLEHGPSWSDQLRLSAGSKSVRGRSRQADKPGHKG